MTLIFRSKEQFEQELILRKSEGWTIRSLSRTFQISRNTVRRILRGHNARRDSGHDMLPKTYHRPSKLDAFEPQIKELQKDYPDITGLRIFEELQQEGYSGGITILRDYLQKHRKLKKEPVIRFETDPGQQGQFDWSPYTLKFTRTGWTDVLCFSYILGFSRRHYIDFTLTRDFYTLIRRHQDAFTYFGGVPKECLYDNEKTVVLRWEAGKPVFNPSFTAFITHYNCRPIACRPKSPKTKGKIEAPFQYVEGNLLCGRTFQDLEDLQATARWWLPEKSDRHTHNTTKRPPIELFMEAEQSALRPLPMHPYDTSEVALALCRDHGFVVFETNQYSVPKGHIADILSIKATEREVIIYSQELELLARHERQPAGSGAKVENPDHLESKKDRYGLEPVRESFLALGKASEEFLKGLIDKHPKKCGFQARFILRLKEHYESDYIHKALVHALRYQAFDGKSIERILKAQAPLRTLESARNERARKELDKTLPRITQRSLDEYSNLFKENATDDNHTRHTDQDQDPSGNPETEGNTERP